MLDIEQLIRYPARDPGWVTKIAVGGLISLIPIINFCALGYLLESMRRGCMGQNELPEWKNWKDLFVKGFAMSAVSLVYSLVPILIMAAGVRLFLAQPDCYIRIHSLGTVISLLTLATLLLSAVSFVLPMSFAQYIDNSNVSAAFRINQACRWIKNIFGDYMITHVLYFGLISILLIIVIIPVIGMLLFLFGSFYLSVVFFNLFGTLYQKSKSTNPTLDLNMSA